MRVADPPQKSPWRRRLKRAAIACAVGVPVGVLLMWIAVHTFPGLGPVLADGLRSVVGADRVSRLEDFVYGVEDSFNQWWRADEAPKAYWDVPSSMVEPLPEPAHSAGPIVPPFAPKNVGPLHSALAAKGDGVWVPVVDPGNPRAPTSVKKTLIHPDPKRPWAELFVIALDLQRVDLHLVAGTHEPQATTSEGRGYLRGGVIPATHLSSLMLAFNGGFKRTHGSWGMKIDAVTLLPPRKHGCAIVKNTEGAMAIRPYMGESEMDAVLDSATWWRQTPPCMFHRSKRHGGLWNPDTKNWGAALGGDTIIRRSALGLDAERTTLFMGVSNHTGAQAIASGMHHAGASDVAQLDVNWSFPKVVVFKRDGAGAPVGEPLFEGFKVAEGEYVTAPSRRDFFYVTRNHVDPCGIENVRLSRYSVFTFGEVAERLKAHAC